MEFTPHAWYVIDDEWEVRFRPISRATEIQSRFEQFIFLIVSEPLLSRNPRYYIFRSMIKSTHDTLFARIRVRVQGHQNCRRIRNTYMHMYTSIDRFSWRKARSFELIFFQRSFRYARTNFTGNVESPATCGMHARSSCTRVDTKNALSCEQ